jgi:DNA-binding transcriptional LysR family regulator
MNTDLASYATVRQLEYLEAVEKHGSESKAAQALGVNQRTVQRR